MKKKQVKDRIIDSFLRKHRFTKEGYADLHTPDMIKIKWVWKQLRTVMLWAFFLLYLSLVKVIPETESISWVGYKSYFWSKVLFQVFKDIYFLKRTSLFVL